MQFVDAHQIQLSVTLNHIESHAAKINSEVESLRAIIDNDNISEEEAWAEVELTLLKFEQIASEMQVLIG